MDEPRIYYDETSDALHISFVEGESATGLELNESILLRINKSAGTAVGLNLFNYSVLAQRTEMGPRSFPLTGLAELSDEMREMALRILQLAPVHNYLTISTYTPGGTDSVPIAHLLPGIALTTVIRHAGILSGEPVFVGTRVPARNLLEWLTGGHTLDDFLDNFPSVQREQAVSFLEAATEALLSRIPRAL